MSEKVMPQPLVLYFSVCILHMVEQLHSVGIIHANIKPDNLMLGKRLGAAGSTGPFWGPSVTR